MSEQMKKTARLLDIEPDAIHAPTHDKAVKQVEIAGKEYWNALANSGQLHGNVPHNMMVAIVYDWLTQ